MVAVVAGGLFMPVETAIVTMTAEAPNQAARRLRAVDFAMHDRLHNGVKLLRVQQAEFAHHIDFFTRCRRQVFFHLIGMVVIGIGVVVVADDIDIRIVERKPVNFLVGAIDHQLMRRPLFDPRGGLLKERRVGVFQFVAGLPGHNRFFVEIRTTGHAVGTGDNLANHVKIGLEGFTVGTVKILRLFVVERRQLLATAPPPPVIDKRQNQAQPLFVRLGDHVVVHPHRLFVQARHAVGGFRGQNMGFATAGLVKRLLHREHVYPLRPGAGLHHRLNPVFLLFRRRPAEVLPPAARVGLTGTARIVLDTVQLRRVDARKAENLVAVF